MMSSRRKQDLRRKAKNFVLINGNLFFIHRKRNYRFIWDFEENKIEDMCERHYLSRHLGITKLLDLIFFSYSEISVKSIKNFVNSCLSCKKDTGLSPQLPLRPIISSFIRERIIVDTVDLSCYFESNLGIKYLFTMIDTFSKFAFVFPLRDKSATSFLNAFKKLYYREVHSKIFHTGNGGQFTAKIVTSFINSIKTDTVQRTSYHLMLRANRTVQ
ncbi:Gypsy retrotransposon integrase-like protein 1 [Cucumispora dikerogammari]|nr:Gypsy retrotransposon integrase-like protein 1 [Cucumispora dikerogammari]